jgi:hypothetical protein
MWKLRELNLGIILFKVRWESKSYKEGFLLNSLEHEKTSVKAGSAFALGH